MNRKTVFQFILALITALAAGCQAESTPSPLSAVLSELSGKVDIKQTGQETFTSAVEKSILEINGQIQTGDDGRVRLDFSSGAIIRVGPSSLFTLTSNEEAEGGLATKVKLEIGKVFIILNGGSAEVETPSGVASVRGSYMKVEVDPETLDIYITCLEGDCSASNPAGTVNFTNGQRVVLYHRDPVTGNWTAPNAEPMTPEEFQEWLDENPEARELFEQAMATITALAQSTEPPTEEPSPTPDLEQAVPPGDASNGCFALIEPISGSSLPKQGPVTFQWSEQPGAQLYLVTFIDQNGRRSVIQTTNPSITHYIEIFPEGGVYNWFVTAYNADGGEICSTTAASFSKPKGDPTPKPTKEKDTEPTLEPEEPQPTEPSPTEPPTEPPPTEPPPTEPPTEPPPTEPPVQCAPADYCDDSSSCYDPVYCEECIVDGVDVCQSECNFANICQLDPDFYYCYDPGASICGGQ